MEAETIEQSAKNEQNSALNFEDIRRSIDVLDQVLSEFDDIEPFYGVDEGGSPSTPGSESASEGEQEVPAEPPPPVDRSLKPKPPTLPEKTRKRLVPGSWDDNSPGSHPHAKSPLSATHDSITSQKSQTSSHEYQEINSDLGIATHNSQKIGCGDKPLDSGPHNPQKRGNGLRDIGPGHHSSHMRYSEGRERIVSPPSHRKTASGDIDEGLGPHNLQLRHRHRSNKEQTRHSGMGGGDALVRCPLNGGLPLRKSRSGDVSLTTEDLPIGRGRKVSRRHVQQRRGRSTERFLDQYPPQPIFFDPRTLPDSGPVDPRLVDPKFIDSRLVNPRFLDQRFLDGRIADQKIPNHRYVDQRLLDSKMLDSLCDPRIIDDPGMIDPLLMERPMFMDGLDGPRQYPLEDPMQFPHLITPPGGGTQGYGPGGTFIGPAGGYYPGPPGPFSLPPPNAIDFHPLPPYDFPFDPMNPDPLFGFPFNPMDIRFLDSLDPQLAGRFDPRLNNFDPSLLPPHVRQRLAFTSDFHMNPCPYPPEYPPIFSPRERMSLDGGEMGFLHPPDPRVPLERGWMPPTPEEARKTIHRIVRNQNEDLQHARKRLHNDVKLAKLHGDQVNNLKSTGSSDSSGRSSPYEERTKQGPQCPRKQFKGHGPAHKEHIEPDTGSFKVGEAVRKDSGQMPREFGGKETISLPRFVSGGKDSGFDESPVVDEAPSVTNPTTTRGGTPVGVGGGFVVAGVFSDSSKMYIPAPPSPTPDYDKQGAQSDGEDFDIPQEPFYVSKQKLVKFFSSSEDSASPKRGSVSDDSLQESRQKSKQKVKQKTQQGNHLQAMLDEFHRGLPPPNGLEEGRFSDDSLEEESSPNMLPPRATTAKLNSQRVSTESLDSMDGSTTSFDYMSGQRDSRCMNAKRNGKAISPKKESIAYVIPNNQPKKDGTQTKAKPKLKASKSEDSLNKDKERKVSREGSSYSCKNEGSSESVSSNGQIGSLSESSTKKVPKFDTIRHLMKEGLIEGLDETPPDFAPPPPPTGIARSSSTSEERADSGIGSTASTNNRADERGGSDSMSEKLCITPKKSFGTCFSSSSPNDELLRRTSSPPPLPPPRDSSINTRDSSISNYSGGSITENSQLLSRNQSWLHKGKINEQNPPFSNKPGMSNRKAKMEKITHIDSITMNSQSGNNENLNQTASINNYTQPSYQKHETNGNIFLENTKNLQSRNDNQHLIDDRGSVSSHSSRSGRFFSRLSGSVKSGSRSNSPLVNINAQQKKKDSQQKKEGKEQKKKAPNKYHTDFIRAPTHNKKEAPQPPILGTHPPDFRTMPDPTSAIPLTRDGSGRFRSIEDLAALNPGGGKSLELKRTQDDPDKKRKKNTTLPPNLTPSDMIEQIRRQNEPADKEQENKNRDDCGDGSRFKFNIFKGFWRRNKYSFDKA